MVGGSGCIGFRGNSAPAGAPEHKIDRDDLTVRGTTPDSRQCPATLQLPTLCIALPCIASKHTRGRRHAVCLKSHCFVGFVLGRHGDLCWHRATFFHNLASVRLRRNCMSDRVGHRNGETWRLAAVRKPLNYASRSKTLRTMSKSPIKFALIADCKSRDLIRLNIEGVTRWAIVAQNSQNFRPVAILSGKDAPFVVNVDNDFGVKPEFEKAVLGYGRDYTLTPDHAGPCEVVEGPLLGVKGSVILTDTDFYLGLDFPERGSRPVFLNLMTGKLSGEPGGGRATFKIWTLWHLSLEDTPVALIESSV
jgi:hypothetical protein